MKKTSNETVYEKIADLTRLVKIRKEYFLKKIKTRKDLVKFFEKIPANKWCVNMMYNEDNSKSCALGHLGFSHLLDKGPKAHLTKLLGDDYGVTALIVRVNDRCKTNPKRRVISFVKTYQA